MRIKFLSLSAALVLVLAAGTAPAWGADALAICNPGQPYLWPGGGANIPFNPDQGPLGPLTNAQAVALTQQSFDNWTAAGPFAVPTSATYVNAGPLPVDVDVTNFFPFLFPAAPDGLSAIVFDDTGEIFDLLFGPGSGILGFAGPEWINTVTCDILEGVSFLNGPTFVNPTAAEDVMTHEFGHYTNLGHVELNGQLLGFSEGGDDSGPTPDNTTFPVPSLVGLIETMYPFYFGPLAGTLSPHADDVAALATLYPGPTFAATTGSIRGAVLAPDGVTRVSGVNVIARNLADPFADAVSTFSGAYTDNTNPADPNVGIYELNGLTPGATYAVFVDTVTAAAGRFSNPILQPLPGPEEYYNLAEASTDPPDDPLVFDGVTTVAGVPNTGIDIIFNEPSPGDPLPVGDDGFVSLFLGFDFCIKGTAYNQVFVNANGNLTFGQGDFDFTESTAEMLDGPPRIAGLWDDLNPNAGGIVTFDRTSDTFTAIWDDVPEWFSSGSNSFEITLRENSLDCVPDGHDAHGPDVTISWGNLTAGDGLAGISGGLAVTSGTEEESDLSELDGTTWYLNDEAACYENFTSLDNDLSNREVSWNVVGPSIHDPYEPNNSRGQARRIWLPFDSSDRYTAIDPPAGDIDWYKMRNLKAGSTLVAEITRGQLDPVLGLFNSAGALVAFNDDANGLLSRIETTIPANDTYFLAVTYCCDYDFDGVDPGQGLPFDGGRYVLEVLNIKGTLLSLGDDDSEEIPLPFDFWFNHETYSSVFVNSNGSLTFGQGDTDFTESLSEFLNGPPRIAPLWDDLNPSAGGYVSVVSRPHWVDITFTNVPEFFSTGSNTFSVRLWDYGGFDIAYGELSATDGLVGTTEGNGATDWGESDLSSNQFYWGQGTTYEQFGFGDENDLSNWFLAFSP